jgi:predicted adenine nucleotide alpha hydrolase (AANH) superfamily ATPase
MDAVLSVGKQLELEIIHHRYDLEDFLKNLSSLKSRDEQHFFCWKKRLEETARMAAHEGIKNFTTTLLSSPYQDVEAIKRLGDEVALTFGVTFLARDFRKGFQKSHQISKEWGLYHQNYCGCLYSEKESIEQREKRKLAQR